MLDSGNPRFKFDFPPCDVQNIRSSLQSLFPLLQLAMRPPDHQGERVCVCTPRPLVQGHEGLRTEAGAEGSSCFPVEHLVHCHIPQHRTHHATDAHTFPCLFLGPGVGTRFGDFCVHIGKRSVVGPLTAYRLLSPGAPAFCGLASPHASLSIPSLWYLPLCLWPSLWQPPLALGLCPCWLNKHSFFFFLNFFW